MAKQNPTSDEHTKGIHKGWKEKQAEEHAALAKQLGFEPNPEKLFPLDKHLIHMFSAEPFYCLVSRQISKKANLDMPTAAIGVDGDDVTMWWNPYFIGRQSDKQTRGLIKHEMGHLVYGHLHSRKLSPHDLWNIATDCAINSIIVDSDNKGAGEADELPRGGIIPGQALFIEKDQLQKMEPKQQASFLKLSALIQSFPKLQSSEWYYDKLREFAEKEGDGDLDKGMKACGLRGDGSGGYVITLDDHDPWGDSGDLGDEGLSIKMKEIIGKAIKEMNELGMGWGSVSAEMQKLIMESLNSVVDWRSVLKYFLGMCRPGDRSRSFRRIDRRAPMLYPGVKRGHVANILIAVDQSGSVDDKLLTDFFGELSGLSRKVTFDVVYFDTSVDESSLFTWKKNQRVSPRRTRCGGTDFNAPTNYVNAPERRGKYDALLICTDGECCAPGESRVKRGYVIGGNNKMNFSTADMVIKIEDPNTKTGVVR